MIAARPGGRVEEGSSLFNSVLQLPNILPHPPLSAGAEVLGQNRGGLLNTVSNPNNSNSNPPNPNPNATTNQPVRVPVKRPSAENSTIKFLSNKMGPYHKQQPQKKNNPPEK